MNKKAKKETNCPICLEEDSFDRIMHRAIYIIGLLTVLGVKPNTPAERFYKSNIEACKEYMKFKEEDEKKETH